MKRNFTIKLFVLIAVAAFTACKKTSVQPAPEPPKTDPVTPTTTATRRELSLDSIFLYAKEVYYWNTNLPTYETFNPRRFTGSSTDLANYNAELLEIAKYSNSLEYSPNSTVPKYSNIFDLTNKNPTAFFSNNDQLAVDLFGNGNDIGLRIVSYLTSSSSSGPYFPFITAVYKGSPADKAGLKREGWYISKINGQSYGSNYNSEKSSLNTALNGTNVQLDLVNYITKATKSVTLAKTVYKSSPVYAKKIFDAGGKKIGYLSFARFSMISTPGSRNVPSSDVDLDPVFAEFATANVTDLIVDLRYNGGGYILTAEHLMNLIAPPTLNGKVMYTEYYNATMQNKQAVIMRNQPILDGNDKVQYVNGRIANYFDDSDYSVAANTAKFDKKGSLNTIQNVVFIVTGNTASASELVINSLKPYVTVKTVGGTTYGKPIGFFPVTIENRYNVYFSMFESKNALGQGGYFNGITPDYDEANSSAYPNLWDDPTHDFGDVKEAYLDQALKVLAPSAATIQTVGAKLAATDIMTNTTNRLSRTKIKGKHDMGKGEFVGMVSGPKRKER